MVWWSPVTWFLPKPKPKPKPQFKPKPKPKPEKKQTVKVTPIPPKIIATPAAIKEEKKRRARVGGGGGGVSPTYIEVQAAPRQTVPEVRAEIAQKIQEAKAKPVGVRKLRPKVSVPEGVSIVSEYKPKTKVEIAKTKKLEAQLKRMEQIKKGKEFLVGAAGFLTKPVEEVVTFPQKVAGKGAPVTSEEIWREPRKGERPEVTFERKRVREEIIPTWKFEEELKQQADIIYSKAQARIYDRVKALKKPTESKIKKIISEEKAKASAKYRKYSSKKLEQFKGEFKARERARVKEFELNSAKYYIGADLASGLIYGGIAAVPVVGKIAIGASIIKGVAEIPKTIEYAKEHPSAFGIRMGAGLTGVAVGSIGIGLAKSALRSGIKPSLSQSLSVSKATKIGKDILGRTKWKVDSRIKTWIKNPKTGKIRTIDSQVISETVTSATKQGAIKATTKSWASSLKGISLRAGVKKPSIKLKVGLSKAQGTATYSSTAVEGIYKGQAAMTIQEAGKVIVKAKPEKLKTKFVLKPAKEYVGTADILAKKVFEYPQIRAVTLKKPKVGWAVKGKETVFGYEIRPKVFGGFEEAIIGRPVVRGIEKGIGTTFAPKELILGAGKKVKIFKELKFKAKPPARKPLKPLTTQQLKQLFSPFPEKTAAEITSKTATKLIGERIITKARIAEAAKTTSRVAATEFIIPSIAFGTTQMTKQKVELKKRLAAEQKARLKRAAKIAEKLKAKRAERLAALQKVTTITKPSQRQTLSLLQKTFQITAPAVTFPTIPITKPDFAVPSIIIPAKETIARKKKKKKYKIRLRQQRRAYQASVGAVALGITSPVKYKKSKRFTGLELRPMIINQKEPYRKNYAKQLNKLLM